MKNDYCSQFIVSKLKYKIKIVYNNKQYSHYHIFITIKLCDTMEHVYPL